MSTRPQFSIHVRAEIEKARLAIFEDAKRFNLLFLPVLNLSNMANFLGAATTAPQQRMSANMILQIQDFTKSLFDVEAKHYCQYTSDSKILILWLNELAGEIRTQAKRLVADDRHDFHCSAQERNDVIEKQLEERIKHWLSIPTRPRLQTPDPPIDPVRGRSVAITSSPDLRLEPLNPIETRSAKRKEIVEPILSDKGMTPAGWATKAGFDPSVVYDYLSGKSKPRPNTRKSLAEALGIELSKLPG